MTDETDGSPDRCEAAPRPRMAVVRFAEAVSGNVVMSTRIEFPNHRSVEWVGPVPGYIKVVDSAGNAHHFHGASAEAFF